MKKPILVAPLLLAIVAGVAFAWRSKTGSQSGGEAPGEIELLNVSYDPTRELWKQLNEKFIPHFAKTSGKTVSIKQSHGGSSTQARAVIDGLEADVVTLAMGTDTAAIQRAGLISADWQQRLPNNSLPYISTIVFVVRKGNPKQIKDWPDLIRDGVEVITPNPKTSGNGKLSFLAGWGAVLARGGSEVDAEKYVGELYKHTPVLDSGARGSTTTFAQKGIGDVHLTWENEAHLEVEEAKGALEIVYPPVSIQAEPNVAWVDANVKRRGTAEAAKAYLEFLYTDEGQDIIAKNHYRPTSAAALARNASLFPKIELFTIDKVAADWEAANKRFFAEGAVFDKIFSKQK